MIRPEAPKWQSTTQSNVFFERHNKARATSVTYPIVVAKCNALDICITVGYPTTTVRTLHFRCGVVGAYLEQVGLPNEE